MMIGRALLRWLGICLGAALGSLLGIFIGEALFYLFFGMSFASAEDTHYAVYAIIFTFNGALFGLFLGGLGAMMLTQKSSSSHNSQSDLS